MNSPYNIDTCFYPKVTVKDNHSRLVLGTVQLGLPYGISNRSGQPDSKSAINIIETAWMGGVRQFDTAQGYGDSEKVLGQSLFQLGISNQAKIISKLDPSVDYTDIESVKNAIYKSLDNLRISCLYGLLFHREEVVDHFDNGILDTLVEFVEQGIIKNIGISVYSPKRAIQAMKYELIKLIQVPANILDSRFHKYGVFDFAAQNGKDIYIRSIFLQGLILLNTSEVPEKMKFTQSVLNDLDVFCHENGVNRKELAIGYIKYKYPDSYVLFGAEEASQVKDNIDNWNQNIEIDLLHKIDELFFDIDENIINPVRWGN